tara:strand:+ start:507 stop:1094 length:588 start_codon:yes stop_codon:yes gene_type:complete
MAGTSTASRASWGVIASSYGQNPTTGLGEISHFDNASGNFAISGIPNTKWKDLELYVHWGQQSTWAGEGYWYFSHSGGGGGSASNQGCYNYWGWSTGSSNGTSLATSQYVYPVSYSSMWSSMHLYCANAFTNQNTKAWWYEAGNSSGSSSSYATMQSGSGVYRSSTPIDTMYFSTPWGNGSSSYQGWLMIGRNPK